VWVWWVVWVVWELEARVEKRGVVVECLFVFMTTLPLEEGRGERKAEAEERRRERRRVVVVVTAVRFSLLFWVYAGCLVVGLSERAQTQTAASLWVLAVVLVSGTVVGVVATLMVLRVCVCVCVCL